MMIRSKLFLRSVAVLALLCGLGCDNDRDSSSYVGGKYLLRPGKHVSSQIAGWVAVPGNEPKTIDDKTSGLSYAVLTTHDVVPSTMSGWVAINPSLFAKMSGIKVEAPKDDQSELIVLHRGELISGDLANWVAVPNSQPQVEVSSTKKDNGLAKLSSQNIVPKELNGWVAVNPDTLATLSEKYMMTGKGSRTSKE